MELKYTVTVLCDGVRTELGGVKTLQHGVNRVQLALPKGTICRVTAELPLAIARGEKIFMNGYQTWTHCPEYTAGDKIRGIKGLPQHVVKKFGLHRYGDYHFVDYPNRRGITHGESWCYFRRGESFRLFASLDERGGYTLFRYNARKQTLTLERDCEGLRCGGDFEAFALYCAAGSEPEVFDGWFAAMDIKPIPAEPVAGYSSWYNRYQNITEAGILQDLDGCAAVLQPGDLFQIDDGWEPFVGDWLETDAAKFPNGLKPLADAIHAKGFKAGLWLAPFVAETKSAIYQQHPDWFLKEADGKPWYNGCNWSGFYSLDIDNPEVMEYVSRCFRRVFDEWGFDLVKLDFLYGAAPYSPKNTETRAGRMYRAMDFLREVCGEKQILGCGVPVMPAFGKVEYCRISCDVGLDWNDTPLMQLAHRERVSTKQAIENAVFRRQLNGRAYLSDPDVFFLRDENLKLTAEEKDKLATMCALFGGVYLTSDDMSRYDETKKAQYLSHRALCGAENIRVEADKGITVRYALGGEEHAITVE